MIFKELKQNIVKLQEIENQHWDNFFQASRMQIQYINIHYWLYKQLLYDRFLYKNKTLKKEKCVIVKSRNY